MDISILERGDESGTIFIVYAGQSVVMKIDPSDGSEIWTNINPNSEYSILLSRQMIISILRVLDGMRI